VNAVDIYDVDQGDQADEGPHEHEWGGGNKLGIEGFAWPFFDPDHDGNHCKAEEQTSKGKRHFSYILVHNQGFGV
jgi:hypothetical protein